MEFKSELEHLPKSWFIDLDGTLLEHNTNILLSGTTEFFNKIGPNDQVIITTARKEQYSEDTINLLKVNNIRYNHIIFNLPTGARILINDKKPDGTLTAYAINLERNKGVNNIV